MRVDGGRAADNLERAVNMIKQAADTGCDIVVLPECCDLGWTCPDAKALAKPIPGAHSDHICSAAAKFGVYVVIGVTEEDNGQVYNAAILVSPQGEILLKHRKINVLDIEQPVYANGQSLAVVDTPLGVLALNICADNFPDSLALGHSLARMGAQIILSPCAWAVPADHNNTKEPYGTMWKQSYTSLAQLYNIPVIGVSNVGWITGGPWVGDKCIGCSLAVSHNGEILTEGPYGVDAEALVTADVELAARTVRGTDWARTLRDKGYVGP